jgi:hypothetical protein
MGAARALISGADDARFAELGELPRAGLEKPGAKSWL